MTIDPVRFPRLSSGVQETIWDSGPMRFVFELEPPTPELIGNVRCAGFSADIAQIRDRDPWDAELLELVAEIRSAR